MIFKQHSFWQSETIHRIFKEVSDETGVSYDDVGKMIRHMFMSLKQELTNPNNLNKILLHHFGSFYTTEKRVLARLRTFVCKYKEGKIDKVELREKTEILLVREENLNKLINQNNQNGRES